MKWVRYPAEFKAEAVKQVTDRNHGVVAITPKRKAKVKAHSGR